MGKRKAGDHSAAISAENTQAPAENWLRDEDPLAEALRIDDLRSEYCQQLENRIAELFAEVEALRALLRKREQPGPRALTARPQAGD
jgi:hypothetical protein